METAVCNPASPFRIDMDATSIIVGVTSQIPSVTHNGVRLLFERTILTPTTSQNREAVRIMLKQRQFSIPDVAFKDFVQQRVHATSPPASTSVSYLGHGAIRQDEVSHCFTGYF